MQDHSPDWYISNGFEYLIFSQGAFGRYFIDPTRYAIEVGRYNSFFSRFPLVARFDDNGYEIRIYKTGVMLPVHRVAARFGDYGDLVELIGYDDIRWVQGEPLPVRLFWRTLRDTPEPLALELRLLKPSDQQIAIVRNDLFQGKGWPQGMFATELMMSVPGGVAPGVYRLDVGVIQTRYAYRVPLMNWAEEKLERLWLSPVKMTASPPSANELQSAQPANVRWADNISLIGYTAGNGSLRAGSVLPLTLYWKSLANPARDYTVFIHLLDAKGKLRAQIDTQPLNGAYSTSLWSTDEIIRDDYLLYLPADLDPGAYRLEIGLYQWPSLERLDVIDSNGQSLGDNWSPSFLISVFR